MASLYLESVPLQIVEGLIKFTAERLLAVCPDDINFIIRSMTGGDQQEVC